MARDFTDFIVYIFDAGHRLYHIHHMRHGKVGFRKTVDIDKQEYQFNGYKYVLELDRAYRVRWSPWSPVVKNESKVVVAKEKWFLESGVREDWFFGTSTGKVVRVPATIYRTEKVPALVNRIKPPYVSVSITGTLSNIFRTKKTGLLLYQMPCTHQCSTCVKGKANPDYCKTMPEDGRVYPMHISRIHQPSGEMRG